MGRRCTSRSCSHIQELLFQLFIYLLCLVRMENVFLTGSHVP